MEVCAFPHTGRRMQLLQGPDAGFSRITHKLKSRFTSTGSSPQFLSQDLNCLASKRANLWSMNIQKASYE
jgi:hypothetical protein